MQKDRMAEKRCTRSPGWGRSSQSTSASTFLDRRMASTSFFSRTGQGVQFSADSEAMRDRDTVAPGRIPPAPETDSERRQRLARASADAFQFVWRLLRRLGVYPESTVDDAVQRVFEIAARKSERVPPGLERAF